MKKEFVEPKVEVVEIEDADVICASNCGLNPSSSTTEGVDL